jgi:hypothetical protein
VCGVEFLVGVVGFAIACAWWKVSERELDRDALFLIDKIFGGIVYLWCSDGVCLLALPSKRSFSPEDANADSLRE